MPSRRTLIGSLLITAIVVATGVPMLLTQLDLRGQVAGPCTNGYSFTKYPIPQSTNVPYGTPYQVATGADGTIWFTEVNGNKIGSITQNGTITEYPVPTPQSMPNGITSDPDGNLWFTEQRGHKIGRITTSGMITEYPTLTPNSSPVGIVSDGDGNIWFTEQDANKIGKRTPQGVMTEYTIPTPNGAPFDITVDADGNIWFTEQMGDKIGKITPQGVITEYPAGYHLFGITLGPDGNIWFAEDHAGIGMVTPSGDVSRFPLLSSNRVASHLTAGLDGKVWFSETGYIASITTGGVITEYPDTIPHPTAIAIPYGITTGLDGTIWFAELNYESNDIGKLSPCTGGGGTSSSVQGSASSSSGGMPICSNGSAGVMSYYPPAMRPSGITQGGDGNTWFIETGNKIGKMNTAGTLLGEYPVPTNDPYGTAISAIAKGPDGNIWFGAHRYDYPSPPYYYLGKMDAEGTVTTYDLPRNSGDQTPLTKAINAIAAGSDGNVWFSDGSLFKATTSGTISRVTASITVADLTLGPDGHIWIAGEKIGRVENDDTITYFDLAPYGIAATGIAAGSDGRLWFTDQMSGASGYAAITTDGDITVYPALPDRAWADAMTAGPDGNLYFIETASIAAVARVNTNGEVTGRSYTGGLDRLMDLTAGSDGNIWVTSYGAGSQGGGIYKLTLCSGGSISSAASSNTSSGNASSGAFACANGGLCSKEIVNGLCQGVDSPGCPAGKHWVTGTVSCGTVACSGKCDMGCVPNASSGAASSDQGVSYCGPACGDSNVSDGEECDDGNTSNNDGCSARCEKEIGWDCNAVNGPSDSVCSACMNTCNIPLVDGACIDSDGGSNVMTVGSTGGLTDTCIDAHTVNEAVCAEGTENYVEIRCPYNSGGCQNGACLPQTGTLYPGTGDSDGGFNIWQKGTMSWTGLGVVPGSERCENSDTVREEYWGWTTDPGTINLSKVSVLVHCPNGCSDGACLPLSAQCNQCVGAQCSAQTSQCSPVCGDGIVTGNEECDDGNIQSGDGCTPTCTTDAHRSADCGNGKRDSGEQCDDGDTQNGDGCSDSCQVENGWQCMDPSLKKSAGSSQAGTASSADSSIAAGECPQSYTCFPNGQPTAGGTACQNTFPQVQAFCSNANIHTGGNCINVTSGCPGLCIACF